VRIFVTGSTGILGRHLCRILEQRQGPDAIIRSRADITDASALRQEVSQAGPVDIVLHLAALVPVAEVQGDPDKAYDVNVGGTLRLLDAFAGQSARFVYCSTSHVYTSSADPIAETAPTRPVSLYGHTKWIAEIAAQEMAAAYGIALCIPRVFSFHDPAQTGSFLRPNIERRLASEDLSKPFELYGALSLRDMLSAEEAARRLALIALSGATGPVNIGSGKGTLIKDFVQSLTPTPLNIAPMGTPDALVADISRLRAILGDQITDDFINAGPP
tara:strand:+ start:62034 stop:62852 length:819 start_codon:yes stop_codon:yes gene_type:complete